MTKKKHSQKGFSMKIYAIDNGKVSAHIKDPNFNLYLPVIPSEVSLVNFTWKSGSKKYYYNFDRLQSLDESILKPPTLSIKIKGRIPQEPKGLFNICLISQFLIGIRFYFVIFLRGIFNMQNEIICPFTIKNLVYHYRALVIVLASQCSVLVF